MAVADLKQELLDLPRALAETFSQGRAEYEAVARRTRWDQGPVFVVGSGASHLAGLSAAPAFEALLGWPVLVRATAAFRGYGLSLLRPRSVLLAVTDTGEADETLELARAARSRGVVVLVLTAHAEGPLAQMADGAFRVRLGEAAGAGLKSLVVMQAALGYASLATARVLRRHHPLLDDLEQDFQKLPGHVEWVFGQLADAVRSLASELKDLRSLELVGAGSYHPTAVQGAYLMSRFGGIEAQGLEASELATASLGPDRDATVVVLSGSRCRLRREVDRAAERLKSAGRKIISVTDANDRELADRSTLAILLPTLAEMTGSGLTLALLARLAAELGRPQTRQPAKT